MNVEEFEISGFAVVEHVIGQDEVKCLLDALELRNGKSGPENVQRPHAKRNLLRLPKVRELANSEAVRSMVDLVLGKSARVVRGLLFDKTAGKLESRLASGPFNCRSTATGNTGIWTMVHQGRRASCPTAGKGAAEYVDNSPASG